MGAYGTNAVYGQSSYKDVVVSPLGSTVLSSSVSGDFTLLGWYKTFPSTELPIQLWAIGNLRVSLWNNGGVVTLRVADDTNDILDCPLSADGSDWTLLTIVRSSTSVLCYEGVSSVGSDTWSVVDYGKALSIVDSSSIKCFDLRVLNNGLSEAAIESYYNDVTSNSGNEYCPRW